MDTAVYNTVRWRELPRTSCLVERLFGEQAGPCRGTIHRHHLDPEDPASRTIEVCAAHHSRVHAALRALLKPKAGGCPHRPGTHRYRYALEECNRRHAA
jgi:hypothetical protein